LFERASASKRQIAQVDYTNTFSTTSTVLMQGDLYFASSCQPDDIANRDAQITSSMLHGTLRPNSRIENADIQRRQS
jgi:hypothetical protein